MPQRCQKILLFTSCN